MANILNIGMVIHLNSVWLGQAIVDSADKAMSAYEDREYHQTVVHCGAAFEGILTRLLGRLEAPLPETPGLGTLIGTLRKTGRAPSELLDRVDEANRIRNRAPHKREMKLSDVTEGDALQVLHIMLLVVQWAQDEYFQPAGESAASSLLPVFLSVGTPHRLVQQQFLQRLRSEMRASGVELRTLTGGSYSDDRPFDEIREIMSECRGALVVGMERSHAYTVFDREQSDKQAFTFDRYIPTAWNQIEGSIATALLLPVLVLRQQGIHAEGIFEAENHRHRIREFDLQEEARGLSPDLRNFLAGWVSGLGTPSS